MKVVILGRTEMLYKTMEQVLKDGHTISAIITAKAAPEYEKTEFDFRDFGNERDIPVFILNPGETLESPNKDIIRILREEKPKLGVSMNFPTLIPFDFISKFEYGIINAHPSDLPRYRGNAVTNWAILNGDSCVVLTLHFMESELDAGDIIFKVSYPIRDTTYIDDVFIWLRRTVPLAFSDVIKKLERRKGSIESFQQHGDVIRAYPRLPRDSEIDWDLPARKVNRMVHALGKPYSGAYTFYHNRKMYILKSHMEFYHGGDVCGLPGHIAWRDERSGEVAVICGDGGFLVIEKVCYRDDVPEECPTVYITTVRERLGFDPVMAYYSLRGGGHGEVWFDYRF